MAIAPYARSKKAPDTTYLTFATKREQKSTLTRDGDLTMDTDTGRSPVARYLAYAFDYSDVTSVVGTGAVIDCPVPRGTLVRDAFVRIDEAFVAGLGSLTTVDIGDSEDADGYMVNQDFTSTTVDEVPSWWRDASAAYINKAATDYDTTAASQTAARYYPSGGTVRIILGDVFSLTAGKAILFLETISYNEPVSSEWS